MKGGRKEEERLEEAKRNKQEDEGKWKRGKSAGNEPYLLIKSAPGGNRTRRSATFQSN
jgi:hypothetical protein